MTFESDLFTLIRGKADRVFPDFAPVDTPRPYVTYQSLGGQVINPLANVSPGKRNAELQLTVWADTRMESLQLSREIEDGMRQATAFQARPLAAAVADYDADVPVYGCRQDFSCWFNS